MSPPSSPCVPPVPPNRRAGRHDGARSRHVAGRVTLFALPAKPPDGAQDDLLAENPALADYFRSSTEAALDLQQLIREAAKKE